MDGKLKYFTTVGSERTSYNGLVRVGSKIVSFTSFSSLNDLISKINKGLSMHEIDLVIDESDIVEMSEQDKTSFFANSILR